MLHPFVDTPLGEITGTQSSSSGHAAVWAMENTREAIWDAMERKEVYATTGPRMLVRFFGGWDYTADDLNSRQPAFRGYEKGVPMGGDLPRAGGRRRADLHGLRAARRRSAPTSTASRSSRAGSDDDGTPQERVYDVAWSDDREPDARRRAAAGRQHGRRRRRQLDQHHRRRRARHGLDRPRLRPGQRAFYYARVLEIPTPRWVVYDAFRFGVPIPEGAETTFQERAYTSPIWYTPAG